MNPTVFRATLYFAIAFLTPFSERLLSSLNNSTWPSAQQAIAAVLVATISGLVALRAYYDGSALRNEQEAKATTQPKVP